METLLTIGRTVLVLIAITGVAFPLICERRNYKFVWHVWKRFSVKMFCEVLSVIVLTVTAFITLYRVPGLSSGWMNFFFVGGGNMSIRPITEGSESTYISIRLLVPIFFVALALILPFLAKAEEEIFRKGHDEWGSIVKQSIKFGLAHCIVGVPLGVGIALVLPGLFFGYKYKRARDRNAETLGDARALDEAVMVSTAYHTMYNMVVVAFLLAIAVARI